MNIKNYEGLYAITKSGRVYSYITKKFLTHVINNRGYAQITLCKNKIKRNVGIHTLVAEQFIPNEAARKEINHKDGNKINNHVDNLEWCTRSYNIKHAYDNGLHTPVNQHNVMVYKNSILVSSYVSMSECARQLKIPAHSVRMAVIGKYSQTHGYVIERAI